MSASQQKKTRQQQREEGVEKHQISHEKAAAKAKKAKTTYTIVGTIAVLLIAASILISSSLFYKNFDALKVGDEGYTAAEMNYFYQNVYQNFLRENEQILPYMGLDTTKSLSSQQRTEDMTWGEFFKDNAIAAAARVSAFWSEAQKAGFKLDEATQAELDAQLEVAKTSYVGSNYKSADAFFAAAYGKGVNLATINELLTKQYIASGYEKSVRDSFTYTDSELAASYTENKADFDTYNYLSYYASGAENKEKGIDAETAMKTAKELADSIVKDSKTAEDFKAKTLALTKAEASEGYSSGSYLSETAEAIAEWMKDSARREGDMTVIQTESGYYAVYYISRDVGDYKTASVRHILVRAEADEDGAFTDEAKKAAKTQAENLLKEWKAGDKTEESFTELALKNSGDVDSNGNVNNDGLYENFPKHQMVAVFEDWAYDTARKPGDTGIVFNDGSYVGYHVMYYVGQGEKYQDVLAKNKLLSDDITQWDTDTLAKYETKTGFTMIFVK